MLSREKKIDILNEITRSKTFQKATTSTALLKYLVKAEIENTYLKEDIIDLEFFCNNGKTDKSNTRVRVSMYNLRKKLNDFYENENKEHIWKIIIDKGQYSVRYEQQSVNKKSISQYFTKHLLGYSILCIIIVALILNSLPPQKPSIWKAFIQSKTPTTLFIGDAFGMKGETITGGNGFTRDYNINSVDEYYRLVERKTDLRDKLTPSNYQYFTSMGATAAHNLTLLFSAYHKNFDIKFISNTSLDDIKNGNAIYVGPLLNENKFIALFNDAIPFMTLNKNTLQIHQHPTIKDTIINVSTSGKKSDIAIVSKIPGPMGTEQFLFFSNHDMGVSATIEYFTNRDSIKTFKDQYLQENKYFIAIYKALGRERTSLDLKMMMVIPF